MPTGKLLPDRAEKTGKEVRVSNGGGFMSATVAAKVASRRLECMEIWGGNQAADNAVSVSGIDCWVISEPHGGDASGGDMHFVSTCGAGKIARFALADVAGHGLSVSDMAVKLRRLMRKHINRLDQTRFARDLNKEFGVLTKLVWCP